MKECKKKERKKEDREIHWVRRDIKQKLLCSIGTCRKPHGEQRPLSLLCFPHFGTRGKTTLQPKNFQKTRGR